MLLHLNMSIFSKIKNFIFNNLTNLTYFITNNSYELLIFTGVAFIIYRISPLSNKTDLFYKETKENDRIAKSLEPYSYSPTIWMPLPSLQIAFHDFFFKPKKVNFKREYITCPDGGEFSFDWVIDDPIDFIKNKNRKIFLILHGLTGGSQTIYMRDIITEFKKLKEFKIVVLHNRGINDTPLKTPRSFHAAFTDDVNHAFKVLKQRFPDYPVYTMGISMGANILTKYFATDYDMGDYVKCFISISNPLDFNECESRIKGGIIDRYLKDNFRSFFETHPILKNNKGKI